MADLLEIQNVIREYHMREGPLGLTRGVLRAVDRVSLSVRAGETLGLVGESGCGKSTLARLMLGLEDPDVGAVLYKGKSLFPAPPADFREKVQMVFQDPYSSLNPRRSVGAIIGEPLAIHRHGSRRERANRVRELLSLVGLRPEDAARYPHEFSGGQRQRVAIARALALNPELVVCDEAVSALDVSIQAQIINLLQGLQEKLGLTYVFISHDLAVVNYVSRRVAVMYLGRLVELAERDELYANPLHPYTRTLLSAAPEPDPRKTKRRLRLRDEAGALPPLACAFAPRCPLAEPACSEAVPDLREVVPGHFAACVRA
ncbi:ABC transporter ATP-binding protein [Desulfocurvibacter africanus]|uniref:ABC transporter ATP-binding protein n=1 Tax=Desulfocurvibacter africanus TaxID=873 RepID=UPI0003FD27CD|nr:oligopeptide/dipeptide ABC transporter ATP-binding protein [Desulfocurvibacter africanus]